MTNSDSGTLFGHPRGLFVLFFAEMWERFSFYGMKALLVLYMVNYLFWKQAEASTVMAWYAGLVYATPILGGIIADKWLGARWSVVLGGVVIAVGHFLLAFEPMPFFYGGLTCIVIGTGFLKPNISTQVGAQYRTKDERRDSAFTIFYMGINLGAFIGPLVCDYLRINYGWHYGFAAAGVGMVLGLIVYIAGMGGVVRRERQIAAEEAAESDEEAREVPVPQTGVPPTEPQPGPVVSGPSMARVYLDRSIVLVVICVFAILFWVGFEQAANVMNLWADQHTNLFVFRADPPEVTLPSEPPNTGDSLSDWQMGAAMTQSINPAFIISLAAVFAWLWQALERRKLQPSTPMKMGIAMVFLATAYGILVAAAATENREVSAPLSRVPQGVELENYGATRLRMEDGTLKMNGVLTDLDWMRALGASSTPSYKDAVAELVRKAEAKDLELRERISAGTVSRDEAEDWEVEVSVPAEAGALEPIAAWPTKDVDGEVVPKVVWDVSTRTLRANDVLANRDEAQVLAAGADPEFREAITSVYTQSSLSRVSIGWLLAFYFVLTVGELCLSPVGLSLVTKAAPPKYVGLFMGFWFFTTGAVSNFLAHSVGGYWGTMTPTAYFMIFGIIGLAAAVIMLVMLRFLKPLLHGIH